MVRKAPEASGYRSGNQDAERFNSTCPNDTDRSQNLDPHPSATRPMFPTSTQQGEPLTANTSRHHPHRVVGLTPSVTSFTLKVVSCRAMISMRLQGLVLVTLQLAQRLAAQGQGPDASPPSQPRATASCVLCTQRSHTWASLAPRFQKQASFY